MAPSWARAGVRPAWRVVARAGRDTLQAALRPAVTRAALNGIVNAGIPGVSDRFLDTLGRAAMGRATGIHNGVWRVRFPDRTVEILLSPNVSMLRALQVLRHDGEVKRTYARLLRTARPDLFLDIGANEGMDSLFFHAAGIATISFEPNPACHGAIAELARAAGAMARIEAVALGDTRGEAILVVPPDRTSLGTVVPDVEADLRGQGAVVEIRVPLRQLDDYLPDCRGRRRVLIKIDTEGSEAAVIRGGRDLLREIRPAMVFEAWPGEARTALHALLADAGYAIRPAGSGSPPPLSAAAFRTAPGTNFLAVPAGSEAEWGLA